MSDLDGWSGLWGSHEVAVEMSAGAAVARGSDYRCVCVWGSTFRGLCHVIAKLVLADGEMPQLVTICPSTQGCLSVLMTR